MINAEVFKQIFGIYATELWAMSESEFLEWLNAKHIATDSRPKGKWIEYTDCEGKSRRITCDQCSHKEWNWFNPNFCSNCGAEMRGDENETNQRR